MHQRFGLDFTRLRAFADHPRNGAFARDLVKSYLQWGLTGPLGAQARTLIDNIANRAAAGVPVLMRASAVRPRPAKTRPVATWSIWAGEPRPRPSSGIQS